MKIWLMQLKKKINRKKVMINILSKEKMIMLNNIQHKLLVI